MKSLETVVQQTVAHLTPRERADAVAYVRARLIAAGTPLPQFPGPGRAARDSYLVFIDLQPLANWGHDCRYLLIDAQSDDVLSSEARFPPAKTDGDWRIAYRADGVPDAALWVPG